jgi:hypothetical protein
LSDENDSQPSTSGSLERGATYPKQDLVARHTPDSVVCRSVRQYRPQARGHGRVTHKFR